VSTLRKAAPAGDTRRTTGKRPWLLGREFFAQQQRHRLVQGDLRDIRQRFIASRFRNLDHLLRSRYAWMNDWVKPGWRIAEFGTGAGFTRLYLSQPVILTDVFANPWLDAAMDAVQTAFASQSLDAIIISNALHHFSAPARFLIEAERVLKPGGVILINEAYASLMLRLILRATQHEGYSYDVDVFDCDAIANDPKDPWSGNNAISNLMFGAKDAFRRRFGQLEIALDQPCECLSFLASGGVTSRTAVPELPAPVLAWIAALDRLLVKAAPDLFALSRRTVLKKAAPAG
jgi:SAM-dependent methyltransferase